MTRLESTCATILQKVEKNEARLDTLMLANSTSKIDDPEVLALFPLQKEEDFVYVETKLKDSFEFRDKFVSVDLHTLSLVFSEPNDTDYRQFLYRVI